MGPYGGRHPRGDGSARPSTGSGRAGVWARTAAGTRGWMGPHALRQAQDERVYGPVRRQAPAGGWVRTPFDRLRTSGWIGPYAGMHRGRVGPHALRQAQDERVYRPVRRHAPAGGWVRTPFDRLRTSGWMGSYADSHSRVDSGRRRQAPAHGELVEPGAGRGYTQLPIRGAAKLHALADAVGGI